MTEEAYRHDMGVALLLSCTFDRQIVGVLEQSFYFLSGIPKRMEARTLVYGTPPTTQHLYDQLKMVGALRNVDVTQDVFTHPQFCSRFGLSLKTKDRAVFISLYPATHVLRATAVELN